MKFLLIKYMYLFHTFQETHFKKHNFMADTPLLLTVIIFVTIWHQARLELIFPIWDFFGNYKTVNTCLHAELQIAWEYSSRFPHLKRCTLQCFSDEISIYPNQQQYRYIGKQLFVNNPTPLSYFQFIVIIALDIWPTKMIITVSTSFCRVHLTGLRLGCSENGQISFSTRRFFHFGLKLSKLGFYFLNKTKNLSLI